MKMLASLALLLAALTARAAEWDRYQVILDRHPFGALASINTNAIPDFAKSLRLSALWMAHGQYRAGFEDNADKIKRDFVLNRGEMSEEGIELVDVNVADEAAVIRKGTETATLHVQAGVSTNMPIVNVPGMTPSGGSNTGNPWRDFYERYRQRHQQDGSAPQPPFPMPVGPGGGTFTMGPGGGGAFSVSGGAQGQPIIIQMQAAAQTDKAAALADKAAARASKYSGQSSKNGKGGDSGNVDVPRSSHKHSRSVQ